MSKNVVEQILHVDINNKTPKRIRRHPLLERSAVRFNTRDQQPHQFIEAKKARVSTQTVLGFYTGHKCLSVFWPT